MEQVFSPSTSFGQDRFYLDLSRINEEPPTVLSPITPGKQLAHRHAKLLVEANASRSEYKQLLLEVHQQLDQQDLTFTEKLEYWQKYCGIIEVELDKVRQTPRKTKPVPNVYIDTLERYINCYAEAAWKFILNEDHDDNSCIKLLSTAFNAFGNIARCQLEAPNQHLFQWKNQGTNELCVLLIACIGEETTEAACLQRLATLLDASDQWQTKRDLVKLVESQPSELRENFLNRRLSQEILQENWNGVKFALLFKPPEQAGWLDWLPSDGVTTVTLTVLRRITALMTLLDPAKESAALCRVVDQIFPKLLFLAAIKIDSTDDHIAAAIAAIDALVEAFDHRLARVQESASLSPAIWHGYQALITFVARKTEQVDQVNATCFLSYSKLLLIGAETAPLGIETVSDWQLRHHLICTTVQLDILTPDNAKIYLERLMQHVLHLLGQTPKLSINQANQWSSVLQAASQLEAKAGLNPSEKVRVVIDCWIAGPFFHDRKGCIEKIRPGLELLLSSDCPGNWRDQCLGQIGPLVFLHLAHHTVSDADTFQKDTDLMLKLLVADCVLEQDLQSLSQHYLEQNSKLSNQELERAFRLVTALPYVHRNFSDRHYGWFTPELHYKLLGNLYTAMNQKKKVFRSDIRGQLLGHLRFYHKAKSNKRIFKLTSEPIWELPNNDSEEPIVCTAVATYWLLALQTGIFGARRREVIADSNGKGATRSTPRGPMHKSDSARLRQSTHTAPLQDFQASDSDIAWGILTAHSEDGLPTSPSYKLNWLWSQAAVKKAIWGHNDLARIINSLHCFIGKLYALAISQTRQQNENEVALNQAWYHFMQLVWRSNSWCHTIDPLRTDQADLHGHLLDAFARLPAKVLKKGDYDIWLLYLASKPIANKSLIIKNRFFKEQTKRLLVNLYQLSTKENKSHMTWCAKVGYHPKFMSRRDSFKIGKQILPRTMRNLRHCLDDAQWAEILHFPKRKAREQVITEAEKLGLATTQEWTVLSHCLRWQTRKEKIEQLERFSSFNEQEWVRFKNSPRLQATQRDCQLTDSDWKEIIEFLKYQASKWVIIEARPYQLIDQDEVIELFQQQANKMA